MAPARPDPFGSFNFRVEIEGVQAGAFRACAGLKVETEIFEYGEGGDNGHVHKLIGQTKVGNVTLRKGFVNSDALFKWRDEITKASGAIKRRNVSIVICDESGQEIGRWNCYEAWPVRWEGPEFDAAQQSQAAVEVLEFAPQRLEFQKAG